MKSHYLMALLFGAALFCACNKDDDSLSAAEQLEADIQIIKNHLTASNLTAQSTASGLHYIIEEPGTGGQTNLDDPILLSFTGTLPDNTAGISSYYGPDALVLSGMPPGFREGIQLFQIGGKGKLFMPSALVFGNQGSTLFPPNSVMFFDIELPALCLDDSTLAQKIVCTDQYKIQQYLTDKGLVAQSTASGLHYIIENEGIGNARPTLADQVQVFYKGYLLDERVFDENPGPNPSVFLLSGVIKGWQEGIRLFKKGGKGTLIIPSGLCYGSNPPSSSIIPVNAVLVFDVELVDF